MTLALHCDLRLAAKDAVLGYPEVKHGMISAVSALRLAARHPDARGAGDAAAGAQHLGRRSACASGLINAVVDDVRAEAEAWAATIAGFSPAAVQATKRLATFSQRLSAAERAEIEAARAMVETQDDYKEGAAVFAGRR